MAKLDERLASLQAMSPAELRAEWVRVLDRPAPPSFSRDLLLRELAYRAQATAHGELPAGARRRLDQLARQLADCRPQTVVPRAAIKVGTRLARDWHGRTHHVLVLDGAYLYEDRRYGSLTSIAREITGAGWSGPRFFGLRVPARPFTPAREQAHG